MANDEPIRYISLFSGIEAASVAWHDLGWQPVAFADFDDFPSAVLAHRFPDVPNLKDITKVDWNEYKGKAELVVGGSPCQSFSVAGKRLGMDDPRGNLAIEYLRVIDAVRPKWFVYENVAGLLSSDEGRDFGAFLGLVGELGYGFAYRVLDAQHFGVPQRRRRVFVVGCADADWRSATAVLFEPESLRRDSKKSRSKRKGDTGYSQGGFDTESGWTFGGAGADALESSDRRGISEELHSALDVYNLDELKDGVSNTLRKNPDSRPIVGVDGKPEAHTISDEVSDPVLAGWAKCADINPFAQGMGNTVVEVGAEDEEPFFIQDAHKGELAGMSFERNRPTNTVGTAPDAVGQSFRLDSVNSNSMKSPNPHSGFGEVELSPTLDTGDPSPNKNMGGLAIVQPESDWFESTDDNEFTPDRYDENADVHAMMGSGQYVGSARTNTIVAREGGVGNTQHTLVQEGEYADEVVYAAPIDMTGLKGPDDVMGTVMACVGNKGQQDTAVLHTFPIQDADHVRDDGGNPATGMGINIEDEKQYTLLARGVHGVAQIEEQVMFENHATDARIKPVDVAPTLRARYGTGGGNIPLVGEATTEDDSLFVQNQREEVREMQVAGTLTAEDGMHQTNFVKQTDMAFREQINKGVEGSSVQFDGGDGDVVGALTAMGPSIKTAAKVINTRSMVVRKLTPIECERLQGFPDNWTQVPWRGKPAEECPDSHRYKACGNSMAVPVMRFIGEAIDYIHRMDLKPAPTEGKNRVLDSAQDGVVISKDSMDSWFD